MPNDAPSDQPPAINSADDVAEAMARASQGQDQPQPPAEPPVEPTAEPASPVDPAAPAEPAAVSDPDATPAEPASDQADAERRKLLEFIKEGWGHSFGEKYKDDAEYITGTIHADKLLGQRNEDAVYGRNVRQHEAEFREFLRQRQASQQAPPTPGQTPPPQAQYPEYEQIVAWQDEIARDGDNASPEARRGLEQAQRQMQQAAYEWAAHPDRVAQQMVPHLVPQVAQVAQQTVGQVSANAQETNWINGFEAAHKQWIYQNGQVGTAENLTPDGQRLMQYAGIEQGRGRSPSEALHYAYLTLLAERVQQQQQNQSARPRPVKPAAQHQPAVAAPTGGDPEEEYKQDLKRFGAQEGGLAEHLAKLMAAGQLQS